MCCSVLTILVYNYLSGKNLLMDIAHFILIKQSSVFDLDQKWAKNKDKANIIISLTTIPERINHLELTIKSLLFQSRPPKKIWINLPYRSFRNNEEYVIPNWLLQVSAIQIVRVDKDFGPSTKFIPALEKSEPDQNILVVDDDNLYPSRYIEEFEQMERNHKDVILAASGWRVPKDLIDRPTTLKSNIFKIPPTPIPATRVKNFYQVDIIQGYSAYLIKPRFFDLDELKNFSSAPKQVRFVDDVWISAHSRVKKFVFPMNRFCYSPFFSKGTFKSTSLAKINNHNREDYRDRNNSIAIAHFKGQWMINQ